MAAATVFVLILPPGSWILSAALVLTLGVIMVIPPDRWHKDSESW